MAFPISSANLLLLSIAISTALASADNHMLPGEMLNHGAFLQQGRYTLVMQGDCNLALYNLNAREWETGTGTNEDSRCYATLQSDGNLVIYDRNRSNQLIWASNTGGDNGNYALLVQKDGDVVIYSNPIFATRTNRIGSADVGGGVMNRIRKVVSANL